MLILTSKIKISILFSGKHYILIFILLSKLKIQSISREVPHPIHSVLINRKHYVSHRFLYPLGYITCSVSSKSFGSALIYRALSIDICFLNKQSTIVYYIKQNRICQQKSVQNRDFRKNIKHINGYPENFCSGQPLYCFFKTCYCILLIILPAGAEVCPL